MHDLATLIHLNNEACERAEKFAKSLTKLIENGLVIVTLDENGNEQYEIAPAGVQALGINLN